MVEEHCLPGYLVPGHIWKRSGHVYNIQVQAHANTNQLPHCQHGGKLSFIERIMWQKWILSYRGDKFLYQQGTYRNSLSIYRGTVLEKTVLSLRTFKLSGVELLCGKKWMKQSF